MGTLFTLVMLLAGNLLAGNFTLVNSVHICSSVPERGRGEGRMLAFAVARASRYDALTPSRVGGRETLVARGRVEVQCQHT